MLLDVSITFMVHITCIVFTIGLIGILLNRKNILITIMSIELLLLAVNLNFAVFSVYLDDVIGQIFIVFILVIAAAESAVGLAIITVLYRLKGSIQFNAIKKKFNNKL